MITLEKIQELDKKIQEAVSLISRLKQEKSDMQIQLDLANEKIEVLEGELGSVKVDHDQIEEGILGALSRMEGITDEDTNDKTVEAEPSASAKEPVESEESVIDEKVEEEKVEEKEQETDSGTASFSFSGESMEPEQINDDVNHSEPQQEMAQNQDDNFESTMISEPAEEDESQESRSEQDLDIF